MGFSKEKKKDCTSPFFNRISRGVANSQQKTVSNKTDGEKNVQPGNMSKTWYVKVRPSRYLSFKQWMRFGALGIVSREASVHSSSPIERLERVD